MNKEVSPLENIYRNTSLVKSIFIDIILLLMYQKTIMRNDAHEMQKRRKKEMMKKYIKLKTKENKIKKYV